MMKIIRTLFAPLAVFAVLASPALADGKKSSPFLSKAIPPLQIPEQTYVPPVVLAVAPPVRQSISLSGDFGSGGVGAGVGGGFVGGGSRVIVVAGSSARSSATAIAFASATAISNATVNYSGGGMPCGCQ